VPLQHGFYADAVITDIPTYRAAYDHIAAGDIPYRDFSLEYPPLAAGLFWLAGVLPGVYSGAFSGLMLLALCATAVGAVALARALALDQRRQALAGVAVAVSPLLMGDLVETRFDMALAAFLVWTVWAAVTDRFVLAWGLLAAAILLKLVPLALIPAFVIWQRHRAGTRAAVAGAAGGLAAVIAVMAPFVILSPSGTWNLAQYHLDRPLQLESTGASYLLGLHALADIPITVKSSFGSQGIDGAGPSVISAISTVALAVIVIGVAWTLWVGLRRARPPGDARLMVAACAATIAALLVCGKVLSPQFLVWLVPLGFVVAGRYGPAAFGLTVAAMLTTLAYFPHSYWDLVALDSGPIGILVARNALLIALLAACWPRPSIAGQPLGRVLRRGGSDPLAAETAVSARYLVD
jgi:hypothetical protein